MLQLIFPRLQQYLPFTVLKLLLLLWMIFRIFKLQQYLPFTVLKLARYVDNECADFAKVATVLTVYGIETVIDPTKIEKPTEGCNSTYRLRY